MMPATQVQEHARKMLAAMGDKAIAEAAQKARTLEETGKQDDAKDWRRIESALRMMQGPRAT
jgi:hypothetical protein